MSKEIYVLYLDVDGVFKSVDEFGNTIPFCRAGSHNDLIHEDSIELLNGLFSLFDGLPTDLRLVWSASAGDMWTKTLLDSGFNYSDKIGVSCIRQTLDRNLNRSMQIYNTNRKIELHGYKVKGFCAVDDEPSLIADLEDKHKVIVERPPNNCITSIDGKFHVDQDILNNSRYFLNPDSIVEILLKLNIKLELS